MAELVKENIQGAFLGETPVIALYHGDVQIWAAATSAVFTSSGDFAVPSGIKSMTVTVVGGGGGQGGGVYVDDIIFGGGGGGAGGKGVSVFTGNDLSALTGKTVAVVVGAAGYAQGQWNAGAPGGTSSFILAGVPAVFVGARITASLEEINQAPPIITATIGAKTITLNSFGDFASYDEIAPALQERIRAYTRGGDAWTKAVVTMKDGCLVVTPGAYVDNVAFGSYGVDSGNIYHLLGLDDAGSLIPAMQGISVIGYGGAGGDANQGGGAGGGYVAQTGANGANGGRGGVVSTGANAPGHVIEGVGTYGGGQVQGVVVIEWTY